MTREEAIDILFGCIEAHSEEENEALDMAIEALQTDIVHCKECKHWKMSREHGVMCCLRERPNLKRVLDDFCSYGERKK